MEEDRLSDRKIWITGASGRIGTELVKALKADMGNKIVATDLDVDITDLEEVNSHIDIYRPNIVINCAAIPDNLLETELFGRGWEEVWDGEATENVVDRYVGYLRRKLGEPVVIHTVRGSGFTVRA